MVYRVYVEKKPGFDHEASSLLEELRDFLRIEGLKRVRVINRYDVEDIDPALFEAAVPTIFSEPPLDQVLEHLPQDADCVLASEYLPGQFDQRADSAAQCVQLMAQCDRPTVRTAQVYLFYGQVDREQMEAIKKHLINPVEKREASLDRVQTLRMAYDRPETVPTLTGFTALDAQGLAGMIRQYGLAMDQADIAFCQRYFQGEKRDPTLTELRMIDTYWSDHCRHTTFLTHIDQVRFEDADVEAAYHRYQLERQALGRGDRPVTLMDLATIGAKALKAKGLLNDLDESE